MNFAEKPFSAQSLVIPKVAAKIFEMVLITFQSEMIEMAKVNFKELLALEIYPR
jgi:hypothetical protein